LSSASGYAVSLWVSQSVSPSPFLSLTVVLRAMRGAVGFWGGQGFLAPLVALLLHRRLGEICRRFEGLAARFRAGTLRRRELSVGRDAGARKVGSRVERIWPFRFGWLLSAARHHAAVHGAQLRVVLETPEMVELLLVAPQARRLLRPVCRMLAIEPGLLRPRAAGEVVVGPVVREVTVRVRRPRVPVDYGRIPLPRGVLSWIRRERSAKKW